MAINVMLTTTSNKLKADDYLQELAAQSGEESLKSLIGRVLSSRAVPDATFLDGIYKRFLTAHKLRERRPEETGPAPQSVAVQRTAGTSEFVLKSLRHESGVNALVHGATIPFHPKLTVVYGKNGSGKSGFVRILKELPAPGRRRKSGRTSTAPGHKITARLG